MSENVTEAGSTCCLIALLLVSSPTPATCHLGRSREDRAVNVNHICPQISSWTRCICLMLLGLDLPIICSPQLPNKTLSHKTYFSYICICHLLKQNVTWAQCFHSQNLLWFLSKCLERQAYNSATLKNTFLWNTDPMDSYSHQVGSA